MVKRQSKKNKGVALHSIPYDCTPPDSEGHVDAVGYFLLPCSNREAAQVADSHSPAFTQVNIYAVYGGQHDMRTREVSL